MCLHAKKSRIHYPAISPSRDSHDAKTLIRPIKPSSLVRCKGAASDENYVTWVQSELSSSGPHGHQNNIDDCLYCASFNLDSIAAMLSQGPPFAMHAAGLRKALWPTRLPGTNITEQGTTLFARRSHLLCFWQEAQNQSSQGQISRHGASRTSVG